MERLTRTVKEFYDWNDPMVVDLRRDYPDHYSLHKDHPAVFQAVQEVFKNQALRAAFEVQDTTQKQEPAVDGVTWHSSMAGLVGEVETPEGSWMIKHNYKNMGGPDARIDKFGIAPNWPVWMGPWLLAPIFLALHRCGAPAGWIQHNDVANPLRVVPARKGNEAISADPRKYPHLEVEYKYLFPRPGASPDAPVHEQYLVVAPKKRILSGDDTLRALSELPEDELRQVVRELAEINLVMRLTDLHLENVRVLEKTGSFDDTKLAFIDTEPLGGLVDVSQTDGWDSWYWWARWDAAAFAVIGLRKLEWSTKARIEDALSDAPTIAKKSIPESERAKFERFHQVLSSEIDIQVEQIARRRAIAYGKVAATAGVFVIGVYFLNRRFHIFAKIRAIPGSVVSLFKGNKLAGAA